MAKILLLYFMSILDYPGKCWREETQTAYLPGDTFKAGCGTTTCLNPEDGVYILQNSG